MIMLRLNTMLARLSGQDILFSIRFIPSVQTRTDRRGRTIGEYETLGDTLSAFKSLERDATARKEKVHGHYYISIEARSGSIEHQGEKVHGGNAKQVDLEEEIASANAKAGSGDFKPGGVLQDLPAAKAGRAAAQGVRAGTAAQQEAAVGAGAASDHHRADAQEKASHGSGRVKLADLGRRE